MLHFKIKICISVCFYVHVNIQVYFYVNKCIDVFFGIMMYICICLCVNVYLFVSSYVCIKNYIHVYKDILSSYVIYQHFNCTNEYVRVLPSRILGGQRHAADLNHVYCGVCKANLLL